MKGKFLLLLTLLLTFTLLLSGCKDSSSTLSIATGGEGGNYYVLGNSLKKHFAKDEEMTLTVKTTEGSVANLRLVANGLADFAIVQSDTLIAAQEHTGVFSGESLSGYSAVAGLYSELCQFIVRRDSGFDDIYDLKGKRISIGAENSGVAKNAEQILNAEGIRLSDVDVKHLSFTESAEALKNGELDAFVVTAGIPVGAVASLAESLDIRILSLDSTTVRELTGLYNYYSAETIPAGTYKGQTEDVLTIGVKAILVANNSVSPKAVDKFLYCYLDHAWALKDETGFDLITNPWDAVNTVPIPFHPGAQPCYDEYHVEIDVTTEPKKTDYSVSLDMYQTLAVAVVMLVIGAFLRKKIRFLDKFCIPAPVIGGLLFAIVSCILFVTGQVEFHFDETLKNVCMIIFFTSVGFQADLKALKQGGIGLIIFLAAIAVLIVLQNGAAIGLAKVMNLDPLVGLCTGSIPMVGGHGTSGAFGPLLEGLGLHGAGTLCTAAATFGLIGGSLMGGPVGRRLILKHKLLDKVKDEEPKEMLKEKAPLTTTFALYGKAAYLIAISMGIGTVVSSLLSLTGMTFPAYIGSMIIAAIIRNVSGAVKKDFVPMPEINSVGNVCMSLFLGIAMITLKLWQLASLALPLFILLIAQTVLMFLFAYFVVFNVMGRDYDAAILAAGTCGFGMGATPNAMANMQALTDRYKPSVKAYLLVPIVGGMFADFINSLVITFFINLL